MGLLDAPGLTKTQAASLLNTKTRVETPSAARIAPPLLAANVPTITPSSTGSGATGTTSPITSPLNSATFNFTVNAAAQHLSFRNGANYASTSQNSVSYWQSKPNNAITVPESSIEFEFSGTEFAVMYRNILVGQSAAWIWIDGQPVTAAPVDYATATGTSTGGQPYWVKVTWGASVTVRVRIWLFNADFGRISYAAGNYMNPIASAEKRIFMYGDSWIDGAASVNQWQLHGHLVPRLLGMEGIRGGEGGTGYLNPSTGTPKAPLTDAARLAIVAGSGADYCYIHGVQNDYASGTSYLPADVGTAAASVYSQLATAAPNMKLIVVPSSYLGITLTSDMTAKRAAVITAAQAAPNVIGIIDAVADATYGKGGSVLKAASGTAWIQGTGNSGGSATDGTNSWPYIYSDQAHLTAAGHRYWALRAAIELKRIIEAA